VSMKRKISEKICLLDLSYDQYQLKGDIDRLHESSRKGYPWSQLDFVAINLRPFG
jgi:hypothetical protein